MRCGRMICGIVALTILGASRAPAGTLTFDFAIEQVAAFTGVEPQPVTGSARVVLTGVDELGMIREASPRGSLESFQFVMSSSNGLDRVTFQIRLENPVSSVLETLPEAAFETLAFRFEAGVVLPIGCVGPAAICADSPDSATLGIVSLVNAGMPGGARLGVFFGGEGIILGLAVGSETARTFAPGSGQVPEPVAGAMLLLGLCAHALRATWARQREGGLNPPNQIGAGRSEA